MNNQSNEGNNGAAAPSGGQNNQSQAQYRAQLLAQQRAALAMAQQNGGPAGQQQQQSNQQQAAPGGQAGSPPPPRPMPRPGQPPVQQQGSAATTGTAAPGATGGAGGGGGPNPAVLQMLSQNPAALSQFLQTARENNQLNEQQIAAVSLSYRSSPCPDKEERNQKADPHFRTLLTYRSANISRCTRHNSKMELVETFGLPRKCLVSRQCRRQHLDHQCLLCLPLPRRSSSSSKLNNNRDRLHSSSNSNRRKAELCPLRRSDLVLLPISSSSSNREEHQVRQVRSNRPSRYR